MYAAGIGNMGRRNLEHVDRPAQPGTRSCVTGSPYTTPRSICNEPEAAGARSGPSAVNCASKFASDRKFLGKERLQIRDVDVSRVNLRAENGIAIVDRLRTRGAATRTYRRGLRFRGVKGPTQCDSRIAAKQLRMLNGNLSRRIAAFGAD